ncbi:hypothetical protein E2C01_067319 [Portunus trituberculatus]|uniref:Uncharacterized protein n=1 Tax=Portunus trituberculatus TaxID=210409 RepID=A0A5B7HSB0_PORTR|nr:hypothetical protein [Portunus trituberculatus]
MAWTAEQTTILPELQPEDSQTSYRTLLLRLPASTLIQIQLQNVVGKMPPTTLFYGQCPKTPEARPERPPCSSFGSEEHLSPRESTTT